MGTTIHKVNQEPLLLPAKTPKIKQGKASKQILLIPLSKESSKIATNTIGIITLKIEDKCKELPPKPQPLEVIPNSSCPKATKLSTLKETIKTIKIFFIHLASSIKSVMM